MKDARDEIKARLSIEDLVGEYLELKRSGRNFKALSPWTNERTPSFIVSPEKQIWYDFSSNRGGDVFGFLMEVEGVEFREALEMLARRTGVELSSYNSKQSAALTNKRKRLHELLNAVTNFYQHNMIRSPKAIDYIFKDRGLSKEIVKDFKIGFSPDNSRAMVDYLKKKGFTQEEISAAGMLNRFGGDIFKGRMVISLQDASGQPIGFTGRIMVSDNNSPKYLNTPQTLLYDKSRHVFGLSQAKSAIRKNNLAVVVEGNMDVIASHQVDVKNVVATAGTAMTVQHLKAISRFTSDIRLCFDSDAAGIRATERTIELAQQVGVDISIVTLDQSAGEAKDPDELIKINPKLWEKSIAQPMPAVDWVIDQYQKQLDLSTANGKRDFAAATLKVVQNLNDPVEKEHYLDEISARIGTSRKALLAKASDSKKAAQKPKKRVAAKETSDEDSHKYAYEDDLLSLALALGEESVDLLAALDGMTLGTEDRRNTLSILSEKIEAEEGEKSKIHPKRVKKLQKYENYVKILSLKADERYSDWSKSEVISEIERLIRRVKIQHLENQKQLLQEQLQDAEIQNQEGLARKTLLKITKLNKEINSVKTKN